MWLVTNEVCKQNYARLKSIKPVWEWKGEPDNEELSLFIRQLHNAWKRGREHLCDREWITSQDVWKKTGNETEDNFYLVLSMLAR